MKPETLERIAGDLRGGGIGSLRALASELSEEAFLHDSQELADLSAIAYCLAKFMEKHYVTGNASWGAFVSMTAQKLELAGAELRQGRREEAGKAVGHVLHDLEGLNASLGRFHTSVLVKARVKIAANAYAHGASLGRAAAFAGVEKKLLAGYIGATRLGENYATIKLGERLERTRELFE